MTVRDAPVPRHPTTKEACEAAAKVWLVLVLLVVLVVLVLVLLDTKGGRPRPTQRMLWEWCWSCCWKKRKTLSTSFAIWKRACLEDSAFKSFQAPVGPKSLPQRRFPPAGVAFLRLGFSDSRIEQAQKVLVGIRDQATSLAVCVP